LHPSHRHRSVAKFANCSFLVASSLFSVPLLFHQHLKILTNAVSLIAHAFLT
jgi:hypothetical protein